MGRKISLFLLFVLPVALLFPQPAYADVAPPDYPPGAAVGTEAATNVQMVSETVSITIEASDEAVWDFGGVSTNHIVGHVEAIFNMVNQGSEAESLEVWFPLGVPDGFNEINQVQNFKVWANEEPVTPGQDEVPGQWDYLVPRAIWEVTFPPGEMVVLRVTYDLYPTGYSPYGTFGYILETGAGWFGSIGQGTITVTMPYPINRFNVAQNPYAYGSPNPPGYTVDGNTLVWEFTDLEPTAEDNISLTVLEPDRWLQIAAAEATVAENPDSVEALLELARARVDALSFKHGLNSYGDSFELSKLALSDYEHAIELDPQNVDIRVEYLYLLSALSFPLRPGDDWDAIYTVLKEAFDIDPSNEQVLEARKVFLERLNIAIQAYPDDADLKAMYNDIQSWPAPTGVPGPTYVRTPVTASPTPPPTPVLTLTPEPQATVVPTPVPPSPVPTSTPIAVQTRRVCPGAAVLLLVPLGLVLLRRRE